MFLYINEFQNFISIIKQPIEEKKSTDFQFGGNSGKSSNGRRLKNQRGNNQEW